MGVQGSRGLSSRASTSYYLASRGSAAGGAREAGAGCWPIGVILAQSVFAHPEGSLVQRPGRARVSTLQRQVPQTAENLRHITPGVEVKSLTAQAAARKLMRKAVPAIAEIVLPGEVYESPRRTGWTIERYSCLTISRQSRAGSRADARSGLRPTCDNVVQRCPSWNNPVLLGPGSAKQRRTCRRALRRLLESVDSPSCTY